MRDVIELKPGTRWDDPARLSEASEFFLVHYNNLRRKLLLKKRTVRDSPQQLPSKAECKGHTIFQIGLDNLPEKIITEDSFSYILKVRNVIAQQTSAVPDSKPTPAEAGFYLTRRCLMVISSRFAFLVTAFLAMDSKCHPKSKVRVNTTDLFAVNEWVDESLACLRDVAILSRLATILGGSTFRDSYGDVMELLQMTSRIFFNMLGAAYGLPAISACAAAFDSVLLHFKDGIIEDQLEKYRQHRVEMHGAIRLFREYGTANKDALAEELKKTIAELKQELDKLKKNDCERKADKNTKRHYRCSNKLAARFFNVSVKEVERWRAFARGSDAKNAVRPPAEFPQGYGVTKEEMKMAGMRYQAYDAA